MAALPALSSVGTIYVRHVGAGAKNGSDWANAYDSLQTALNAVPASTPMTIAVQASTSTQAYAVCARTFGGYQNPVSGTVNFQGGWQDVDTTPTQTGRSAVKSEAGDQPGISLTAGNHSCPLTVTVNRFNFTNVTQGIRLYSDGQNDDADCLMTVSNCAVRAKTDGLYIYYPKTFTPDGAGGLAMVTAENVDIAAGTGGAGHGVYVYGAWMGSAIRATGVDELTGVPRVSTITSSNGCGVYFAGFNFNRTFQATFSNTVIYGCTGQGLYLAATEKDPTYDFGYNTLQAVLRNCTIVDNTGDGLCMREMPAASGAHSANIANCIFANNGSGHGVALGTNGLPRFTCTESYNVFFNNDVLTNAVPKVFAATTSANDPLFRGVRAKPSPWYWLGPKASPAYHTGSTGMNRGAYQNEGFPFGTVIVLW